MNFRRDIKGGNPPALIYLRSGSGGFLEAQGLDLFDGNGAFFANLDTAFAAEAFFGIDGHGFAILHLENFNRADIHALFTTGALFFIDSWVKSHQQTLLSIDYSEMVFIPSI
jgi:hypothetical protein